jgi:halogenation protein CepH
MSVTEQTEVVVMGGGPGGSTCATMLRKKGHDVVLLEREAFPRFMIGESLLPAAWDLWRKLGVTERIEDVSYPVKRGVLFRIEHEGGGFDEWEIRTDEFPQYFIHPFTFHVDRAHFDTILIENAREKGVDVRMECNVDDVIFEGTRAVGVHYTDSSGQKREIRAKAIVDATGRRTVLGHKLARRYADPKLKKVSYFTHYEGAGRRLAEDGSTMTDIHSTDGGWIWYIPLRDGVASVGIVLDAAYVQSASGGPKELYERALAKDEIITKWIEGAHQAFPLKHIPSISYMSDSFVGDGFIMVGDAAMFIDPIFSAGVTLAMRSADFAADLVSDGLKKGDVSEAALKPYEAKFRAPLGKMYRIITNWYELMASKERNNLFSRSKRAPLLRERLVVLLSGGYDKVDMDALLTDGQVPGPATATASM